MIDAVRTLLGGDNPKTVRECRHCGTTIDADTEVCPHCGPDAEIVQYEID